MMETEHLCPKCFTPAETSNEPVQQGGWYGGVRYQRGLIGGVNTIRVVRARCKQCEHEWAVDPQFDN